MRRCLFALVASVGSFALFAGTTNAHYSGSIPGYPGATPRTLCYEIVATIGIRLLRSMAVVAILAIAGCEHSGIFEPFREVSCFEAAKVSLMEAINIARAGTGRVLDADYRQDEEMGCLQNEPGVYDITILLDGRISMVSVNAGTGAIGPREQASVMTAIIGSTPFPGSHAEMVAFVPRLGINMPEAIEAAEKQGGKAMVAWIEARNGRAGYTVKLVQQGRVRETWIDGERRTS